jgi:ATP/maltotriose-dependent transcriptional regulator MalT
VTFPHPLVQAAVYHQLGPAWRVWLHAAAAGLVADEAAALRHRVAATVDADPELAAELEAFAEREADRGARASAAASLIAASRLSPDQAGGERRLMMAVSSMLLAGDRAAARFTERIAGFPSGALRDSVLASLARLSDRPHEAERWLQSAWRQCDPGGDARLAANIALLSAIHHINRLHGREAADWSRRALELAPPGDGLASAAGAGLALALAYAGRHGEAMAAVEAALAGVVARPGGTGLHLKLGRGWLRLVDDDLAGARVDLADDAAAVLEVGLTESAAFGYSWLAWTEFRIGAWDDAVVDAERALAIAEELEHPFNHWLVRFAAIAVPAARGDWTIADEHARQAIPHAGDYEQTVVTAGIARALLATARGDHDQVLADLEPLLAISPREAIDEPGCWPWQDLYGDALVGLGRLREAADFLGPHEALAAERGRRSAIARLARVRGRLQAAQGDPGAAAATFKHGLDQLIGLPLPFERALIELADGQVLRRAGRRRAAADRLRAAQQRLVALGAAPYLARCDRELAACGLAPTKRHGRDRARLTPQELSVAKLAASGLSNREVASELVVTVKTVEFHLRHAFHKLGVASRKELPARLREHEEP